jgi:hypothetical protein
MAEGTWLLEEVKIEVIVGCWKSVFRFASDILLRHNRGK